MQKVLIPLLVLTVPLLGVTSVQAHPIPRRAYDRTIQVHLARAGVTVDYLLEFDLLTPYEDLSIFSDKVDLPSLSRADQICDAFNRCYASVLAVNLIGKLDKNDLTFRCVGKKYAVYGPDGQPLDHCRCEFRFQAPWPNMAPGAHEFTFHEGNYLEEQGRIRLTLGSDSSFSVTRKLEPDAALKERAETDLGPGEDKKRRQATATFMVYAGGAAPAPEPRKSIAAVTNAEPARGEAARQRVGWEISSPAPVIEDEKPSSVSLSMKAVLAVAVVFALAGLLLTRRLLRGSARP